MSFFLKENVNFITEYDITYCVKMRCAEKTGYVDYTFNCVAWRV